MFHFQRCDKVPERSGRDNVRCGPVEVDGRVVWGRVGGVYWLDEKDQWRRWTDGVENGASLGVCGGRMVAVGGCKKDAFSKKVMWWRGGRWSLMSDMFIGCIKSCVISVGGGGLVVMGGCDDGRRLLNSVQVFDGATKTWHLGPLLPKPCEAMSAVVHEDLVYVMGGLGMARAVWCANINDLVRN